MQDPRLAAAWLFALPELESGQAMDEETKKAIWLDYLVRPWLLALASH